jgi:hypothetical protein
LIKEEGMKIRYMTLIGLMAALLIVSGCGKTMLEKNRGRSFETAKYNQILSPEAENNLSPVSGLDGQAADNSMKNYREQGEKKSLQKKNCEL